MKYTNSQNILKSFKYKYQIFITSLFFTLDHYFRSANCWSERARSTCFCKLLCSFYKTIDLPCCVASGKCCEHSTMGENSPWRSQPTHPSQKYEYKRSQVFTIGCQSIRWINISNQSLIVKTVNDLFCSMNLWQE